MIVVTRIDECVVREREENLTDGVEELLRGAALQIRAAVAADKEAVAGEQSAWQELQQILSLFMV